MSLEEMFKKKINDNKDVLLAVVGYDGLLKSELKAPLIKNIIKEVRSEYSDNSYNQLVLEFFKVMKKVYMSDSQFRNFNIDDITGLILEEQLFMTEEFEGEN